MIPRLPAWFSTSSRAINWGHLVSDAATRLDAARNTDLETAAIFPRMGDMSDRNPFTEITWPLCTPSAAERAEILRHRRRLHFRRRLSLGLASALLIPSW